MMGGRWHDGDAIVDVGGCRLHHEQLFYPLDIVRVGLELGRMKKKQNVYYNVQ